MSLKSGWQKFCGGVKGFFAGVKDFFVGIYKKLCGIKESDKKLPLKKIKQVKRKDVGNAVKMFLLIFVALVMLSEATLAVINLFFWKNQNVGAFVIPIAIMPTLAIILTGIIIYINNQTNKFTVKFVGAFDKVAHGEFGYQLEVPKKGQFRSLFENFNKMSAELKSIQTLKDEFIHDFSHEFKTPIASINGFANLLLEGGLSEEEQRQYLKIIADESARLSTLSENTLMLNRLENQQIIGEVKPFRLDLQIKECVILLEREWSAKDIALSSDLFEAEIEGNASLLQQVWINLLNNAIKFTPEGGEINVSMSAEDNFICVSVRDNGIGMSAEVASHIFEKYYQGDSSHATRGNGLGLSIVRRIVTLSGGDVRVESKEGEGSAFIVKLPLFAK
ncbi:MAG TPA: HAMP domain-containing histidine kinase [Candidatus Coproplasma excrementigallinarum]|uniref:histidine kinase n=1 Tax=Candidatus Coproplasma excrementigallinarum TaxID=2840747 RepID=A0A9D1MJA1_9FIRM|nr:HAMP domain-containing histidine kinase [Candidatus Coproplasma excrementigallinarum]